MRVIDASVRMGSYQQQRVVQLAAVAVVGALMWTCWWASSAAATVIKVNTTKETAVFSPTPPVYGSVIVGDSGTPGKCSLREAIQAANTHQAVFGCPAGDGNDTIKLKAGVYHILDNFFIEEKMKIVGPNKGLPGTDPKRGPEAVLSLDNNPNYAAQEAMFWLGSSDQPSNGLPAKGAGTVFNGLVIQGGFVPSCNVECDITAIVQPYQKGNGLGYTLTDSIIRDFAHGIYLGGTDKITRDLFEDNDAVPGATANGYDIYSDYVYPSHDSIIDDNVFKNPDLAGVILQNGDGTRTTVAGTRVEHNLFLKEVNHDLGLFLIQTSAIVKDNLFYHPNPKPLADRGDTAIRMDRVENVQITGNTITNWGSAIKIGGLPGSGPEGSTDVTIAFNRIYDNLYGVKVTAAEGGDYTPLAVDANDNSWGSNGGPESTGARPGAINPVNGVQFFDSSGNPVANQGGITVDRWLHLTCSVPATVEVNVPAPVVGQVVGMPTVDVTGSTSPWFFDHHDPLMAASAPGLGTVSGFDQVPDQGPNNAQLTGTLLATKTGSGRVLVDLDSEEVACPFTATPGTEAGIDKTPDSPTVTAGGLAGYQITVTHRGSVTARNWWVCDRIPRGMTFARANRRVRRLGRLRCVVIPRLRPHQSVRLHVTLRVASSAPSSTTTNIAEVIPGLPPAITGSPGGGIPPAQVPIGKDTATVKVRHPAATAPAPPPVTG